MFAHAIGITCVNVWIKYKKKASQLNASKNKMLYLFHFKISVAEVFTKETSYQKKGIPLLKCE